MIVITCYFNPNNCPFRLHNYHAFYENLKRIGIPVYTAELVFGDNPFELTADDATFLKQCRSNSMMFQKERMLNILLDHLPSEYKSVIWMDCDIVFLEDDWPAKVELALQRNVVVQPYSHAVSLPLSKIDRNENAERIDFSVIHGTGLLRSSFAYYRNRTRGRSLHGGHVGYVWAARREFLDKHRFYDAIITGSGDLFMAMGFLGFYDWLDELSAIKEMSFDAAEHFLEWAFRTVQETNQEIGHTNDLIVHLWHGELKKRDYLQYTSPLGQFYFDPRQDLMLNGDNCWEWATKKPELHQAVAEIFDKQQPA